MTYLRRETDRNVWPRFGWAALLGIVSLYPIIEGTRSHDILILGIGAVMAGLAFKVLPTSALVDLVKVWRAK